MKKILYLFILLFIVAVTYGIYGVHNFKNKLSTSTDIGFSTFYYIFHPTMYPKFYSGYLFNHYEKNKLFKLQQSSPIPYKTIVAAYHYDKDSLLDEDTMYRDRIDSLEDELVCVGLTQERFDQYFTLLQHFKAQSYIAKKYKKIDYAHFEAYCIQKNTSS